MKKFGLVFSMGLIALFCSLQVSAQDKPAPSPLGKVYQRVGVTDIEVTYSRPSMKSRTIFAADGLAPFGKLWRTGANSATKISFSTAVTFGGKEVPAGEYALFSIPGAEEWTIILNSDTAQGGTGSYKEEKDVARVKVPAGQWDATVETFTIVFGNVKDTSADLGIFWEKTAIAVPILVEKTW